MRIGIEMPKSGHSTPSRVLAIYVLRTRVADVSSALGVPRPLAAPQSTSRDSPDYRHIAVSRDQR